MKRWTEWSCCYGNVKKTHKNINRNREALDFMGVPDQPSHCGSNKPTFSQIRLAVLEIWPKTWTGYTCRFGNVMKIHKNTNRMEMPMILWILLIIHHMSFPTSQLPVKLHKYFLRYDRHNAAVAMGM